MTEATEDEVVFGSGRFVYCKSHVAAHETGWCTVSAKDKIALDALDYESACAECRSKGLRLYRDEDLSKVMP